MGNYAGKEYETSGDRRNLDLSRVLTPSDYKKHLNGEFVEGCLQEIPLDIIYYDIISLYEEINFSFNSISYVPEEFSLKVPHLRILTISHNHITSLPSSFHLLLHLRQLDLSFNKIEVFPETICKMQKLKRLNLSNNQMKDLPQSIGNLKKLVQLNVSRNFLRALPESLLECSLLEVLVTLNNQLIHPPQAVCDQGTAFALEHLSKSKLSMEKPVSTTCLPSGPNVFTRIRGHQVMASVNNPESASREYSQAQGTSRTNKRKCPLMIPSSATSLDPDQLKDTILGLVYGACLGDALCLNTEGLNRDECLFYYSCNDFLLKNRIHDLLRSNFPPNDWSSNVDVMLLTLDSLMKWGGVVDELEFVSQIVQWKVHGFVEIDPFPGHLLSELVTQTTEAENYCVHPHAAADQFYKKIKSDQMKGLNFEVNIHDNSCLPAAVVLGIPNFYKENEVAMNAERICKASHTSPLAKACSIFVSLLAADLLKGLFQIKEASKGELLEDIKARTLKITSEDLNEVESEFSKLFKTDEIFHGSQSDDALMCLRHVISSLLRTPVGGFKEALLEVVMQGEKGAAANGCVVGGILGAYLGYSQIPQEWLMELPEENLSWLKGKMNHLLDLFGLP